MIVKNHTNDQVRFNHLGVIMSLLDNKDNYFSYSSYGLIVDNMDYERGISRCHREFRFDEQGLLYVSILYEAEDMVNYNKMLSLECYDRHDEELDEESEDFE